MTEYTKLECINELQKVSEKVDTLSMSVFDEHSSKMTSEQIKYKFGSWNKAKEASGLRKLQGHSSIPSPPDNVDMSKEEWENLTMNERRHRRRYAKLADIKMTKGCNKCGFDKHPSALSFHHIKPEEKSFSIGANGCKPWDKVREEIKKCDVLCRNCHQIETQSMDYLSL
jgi:hypothetical protein